MTAEASLRLSRFVQVFEAEDALFVENIVRERRVRIDRVALEILRALEDAPRPAPDLIRGREHAAEWLNALIGLGVVVDGPDPKEPRSEMFQAFDASLEALPVVDQVELTNVCPMTCFMCPTGTGAMTRAQGFMDEALFERLVEEIAPNQKKWKPLTLHNLGESTLHPKLADFVRLCRDRGLDTELASNPAFMPIALYERLEEAGLSRLVLDVDGLDAETLEKIRGKAAVGGGRAFRNLDAILARKKSDGRARPEVVLQMIALDANRHQHAEFLERFGSLDLRGVEAYLKDADANTRVTAGHPVLRGNAALCRAPWRSVVVLWDGTVVPCCHDANGEAALGDLRRSTLAEIWRGEAARALRARLANSAPIPGEPCADCAHRPDRYNRPSLRQVPVRPLHW